MLIGHRRVGFIEIMRRDPWSNHLSLFGFAFWPRANCPRYEIGWHWSGRLSWSPNYLYELIEQPDYVPGISSTAWTGRRVAFRGFRGCPFTGWFQRIR